MNDLHENEWTKIIVMRVIEGVLTAAAFGVGLWHTLKSKKLEEELDSKIESSESSDEDDDE